MTCQTGVSVLLLLLAGTVYGKVGKSTEDSFCSETKECLLYDVVCAGEEYEVRRYGAVKWASTEADSYFTDLAVPRAFRRLLKYITGANEAAAKIDMTAPVLIKVKENVTVWERSVVVLSFLLPSDFQASPPKPTDPAVYFTDTPDMNVYVRNYGGWMVSAVARVQSDRLKKSLDDAQASYETEFHYNVGFNSPMKLVNRHNEAWYLVKGDPVCPKSE